MIAGAIKGGRHDATPRGRPQVRPVIVEGLSVNGREGVVQGLGTDRPAFGWRLAAGGDFEGSEAPALDRQTAYQVQAAATPEALETGDLLWDTGRVVSDDQREIAYAAADPLDSRDSVAWRVRVWDEAGVPSGWSRVSFFTVGLLHPGDWGEAKWIEQAGRTADEPLPIFARAIDVRAAGVVAATLYLAGMGLHLATVNGRAVTEEHLAPGNSNYQLSTEYRTYDIRPLLQPGSNVVGVRLGHGTAYVSRDVVNPAVGRNFPYAWWESRATGSGALSQAAEKGADEVLAEIDGELHVGGSVNIDTGGGGDRLESRWITDVRPSATGGVAVSIAPPLSASHARGALATVSGNNIAASDPTAGAAISPRMIARIELVHSDGTRQDIVSDRQWRAASGPLATDAWYSGEDFDARRVQVGWDSAGADHTAAARRRDGSRMNWAAAGVAPPPNLATALVARAAPGVVARERLAPRTLTSPQPGIWVFDFGQNFAGWPELNLPPIGAGVTVTLKPAEGLMTDGTVDQASLGFAERGTDLFNTYTTAGLPGGEIHRPLFSYFGMQWVQVEGLPAEIIPTTEMLTGIRLQAEVPLVGAFASSSKRINRLYQMIHYSMASQIMSTFTDCPGREKQSYPADYTMPMAGFHRIFDFDAYLRTTQRHLVEGQSRADTPMFGNVALKTPVHDWGYTGNFGDEINWGNGIVLVPWFLYEYYEHTETMFRYYDRLVDFVDYIRREKAGTGVNAHIVDGALSDWVSAEETSGRITGTWGYFTTITKMAAIARLADHSDDAEEYARLADEIRTAFNRAFLNTEHGYYTSDGDGGMDGASQAAQALALDAGLVPEEFRGSVTGRLVDAVRSFGPDDGPHLAAGTIGLGAVVRQLSATGNGQILYDAVHTETYPGYGYFMASTDANPGGFTTIGEEWNRGASRNHMILTQIVEWFQSGLVGIQQAPGSVGYRRLRFIPQPAGDLDWAEGSFRTPRGAASLRWDRVGAQLTVRIEVPPNTAAEVWIPGGRRRTVTVSARAEFDRYEGHFAVYAVGAGSFTFVARES